MIKLCLVINHGHRKDQDHFIKLVCWAGFNEDRNETIKYHCLDVDESGHSASEAAKAIKTLSELFIEVIKEMASDNVRVEIAHITGDSGGGAAVHRLHPALVQVHVMEEVSAFLGCDMHALNKPLEVACIETFGK